MERLINTGDQLILLAEDDKSIELAGKPVAPDQSTFVHGKPVSPSPEKTLFLGWNKLGPIIVAELDHYVAAGSEVLVMAQPRDFAGDYFNLTTSLKNQKVAFREGDTTSRAFLEALDVFGFDHIVVLCYSHRLSPQQADAHTLITLIHLRDMAGRAGRSLQVTSEMLDSRNRELAEVARADDFIVSDKLISLAMAQVAQNKLFNLILEDLCTSAGSEIYLKPIGDYVQTDCPVTFCTAVASARERSETAFGYRLDALAYDPACNYGVMLNPPKSQVVTFGPSDKIIVFAES
jgi:hypothetical protein